MALGLTIDWNTFIINVPRTGMTLTQSVPTEIRELNINQFRLELKDIEDSVDGMPYPDTHSHNTEVSLGGITYARVVEILDPYSITFEDGQYAVNLVGANSNLGDKVNLNQVSVRSNNSAGLISSPDIEFSSFNGGVMINVDTGVIGTIFPTGTERQKSNNITDALLIATYRGFRKFYLDSDITINGGSELNGFNFVGHSHIDTNVVFAESAEVFGAIISQCDISGVLDGNTDVYDCKVGDITYFNGDIHDSGLYGTIILDGGASAYFENCAQVKFDLTPVINMGGAGQDLVMTDYTGRIMITNLTGSTPSTGSTTGSTEIGIGLDHGQVVLDSTSVTSGTVFVSGIGDLVDENGTAILSGMWNGVNIINRLLNRETITEAAQLGDAIYVNTGSTATGVLFPVGTKRNPVNNVTDAITIAENEGVRKLIFLSDNTFPDGTNINDYIIEGEGFLETKFTFITTTFGCIVAHCEFKNATLTGDMTGIISMENCLLSDLGSIGLIPTSQEIVVKNCLFEGTTTLPSNYSGKITLIDCYSNVVGTATPTFDLGNSTSNAQLRNFTGGIKLTNVTEGNIFSIDLISGQVKLDPATVTGATIVVRGNGKVINADTGEYIYSGIWNGGVTVISEANTPGQTAKETWDENIGDHLIANTMGHQMYHNAYNSTIHINVLSGSTGTTYPVGTQESPVNNLDDALDIAIAHNFNLFHIIGDLTINTARDLAGFTFGADRSNGNEIVLSAYTNTNVVYFEDITIGGILAGESRFTTSVLRALDNFDGGAKNCLITDDIIITGNDANYLTECDVYIVDNVPKTIDVGDKLLNIIKLDGDVEIVNYTGSRTIVLDGVAGNIYVRSSCTSGRVVVQGLMLLTDESAAGCDVVDETNQTNIWNKVLP